MKWWPLKEADGNVSPCQSSPPNNCSVKGTWVTTAHRVESAKPVAAGPLHKVNQREALQRPADGTAATRRPAPVKSRDCWLRVAAVLDGARSSAKKKLVVVRFARATSSGSWKTRTLVGATRTQRRRSGLVLEILLPLDGAEFPT